VIVPMQASAAIQVEVLFESGSGLRL
jgi:hypothetical protein